MEIYFLILQEAGNQGQVYAVWLVSGETLLCRFHVSSLSLHVCFVNYEVEMWSGRDRKAVGRQAGR